MTTIVYRDGVMASDTGAAFGGVFHPWARKMVRGRGGDLYGGAGNAAEVTAFFAWVEGGCVGDIPVPRLLENDGSSFIILIARPDPGSPVELYTANGTERYHAPCMAIGSGAEVAFGALYAGADAETAVRAAIAHSGGGFSEVKAIRFDP